MNRNIKGGFLTLSGVVGIVGMIIVAMQNPATAWVTVFVNKKVSQKGVKKVSTFNTQ